MQANANSLIRLLTIKVQYETEKRKIIFIICTNHCGSHKLHENYPQSIPNFGQKSALQNGEQFFILISFVIAKIDRKRYNKSANFFLWSSPNFGQKIPPQNGAKTFFRFGLHQKNWDICIRLRSNLKLKIRLCNQNRLRTTVLNSDRRVPKFSLVEEGIGP